MTLKEALDEAGKRLQFSDSKIAESHLRAEMHMPGAFGYVSQSVIPPGLEEKTIGVIVDYILAKYALLAVLDKLPNEGLPYDKLPSP